MSSSSYDEEKGPYVQDKVAEVDPEQVIVRRYGRFGPLLSKMFASGVEARGVERVPEDQRETRNIWNKCVWMFQWWYELCLIIPCEYPSVLMWWSVNTVLTTIPNGTLAQVYYTMTLPYVFHLLF